MSRAEFFRVLITLMSVCALTVTLYSPAPTLVPRTLAWQHNDETPSDTLFETFGPRADRLLIGLYDNSEVANNALEANEIDLTDSKLTKTNYDKYTVPPFNSTINVFSGGVEGGFYLLDINNNNDEFLGNPPNTAYPNPVYPNPCSVLGMRKAIAFLCDRTYIVNNITGPYGRPVYTAMLPSCGTFVHPEIRPGGLRDDLCYPYSRVLANASLDSSGFSEKDAEGWRIWNATGQRVELKLWIRRNDPNRKAFGEFIAGELESAGIKVNRVYYPIVRVLEDPTRDKDFHLNTGGWLFDSDPTCLECWQWSWYYHPGNCPNYAGCNDSVFDEAVDNIANATSMQEALAPSYAAQERFAENVLSVPLWCSVSPQAARRRYVGTPLTPDAEDPWEGQYWEGMIGSQASSFGIDNFFSFINMHPKNSPKGDGAHMTIRYGLSTPSLDSLNPIYAEWIWDNTVLDLMYESLLQRNPYDLNDLIPWLARTYEINTFVHPLYGECTKVRIALRPDIFWSDGTPLTAADVDFTLVQMPKILKQRGLPDPWFWWPDAVLSLKVIDPYTFEILLNTIDAWKASSICDERILPAHVWKPICETSDPTTFAPDPNLVASGPWRLKEYVPNNHVELVGNSLGSTIQTNLLGSMPTTSTHGYFRDNPLEVDVHGDEYRTKFGQTTINFTVKLLNTWYGGNLTVDEYMFVDDQPQSRYPVSDISLISHVPHEQQFSLLSEKGKHTIKVAAYIRDPAPWIGQWINITQFFWVTTEDDITGSTLYDDLGFSGYPYKTQLPTPDFKVDGKDISVASKAFGTTPGAARWSAVADVNGDYKVDGKDISRLAKYFGWH